MNYLIVGASQGLGRAMVEGLPVEGDRVIGVSRRSPDVLNTADGVELQWIAADLGEPLAAADSIVDRLPPKLDVLIYNLGIWEAEAFTGNYRFFDSPDDEIVKLIGVNVTATILLLKRVMPALLKSDRPQLILTGSTSALDQSGQPEVAFGASKFALRGIGDTLRENFRDQNLAVTCLQLGDLNTEDDLSTAPRQASERGQGRLIPLHDVINLVRALIALSPSAYVREIVVPAMRDPRF